MYKESAIWKIGSVKCDVWSAKSGYEIVGTKEARYYGNEVPEKKHEKKDECDKVKSGRRSCGWMKQICVPYQVDAVTGKTGGIMWVLHMVCVLV